MSPHVPKDLQRILASAPLRPRGGDCRQNEVRLNLRRQSAALSRLVVIHDDSLPALYKTLDLIEEHILRPIVRTGRRRSPVLPGSRAPTISASVS